MASVVIADAGPLIALAGIDQLEILKRLFGQLLIPQSVLDECIAKPGADGERIKVAVKEGWMRIKNCPSPSLSPSLGRGETDAIALAAKDAEQSLLIMDDRLARRYALRCGLNIVGTVRLLHLAEMRGLIVDAESMLGRMADAGYRVSLELLQRLRAGDGE